MTGLFKENGLCKFDLGAHNTEPVNMLYIDQPVEAGFSLGKTLPRPPKAHRSMYGNSYKLSMLPFRSTSLEISASSPNHMVATMERILQSIS
jgi:hypothetical protein